MGRTHDLSDSRNQWLRRGSVGGRDIELTVYVHHGEFHLVAFGLDIGIEVSVKVKEDGPTTLDDLRRL